MDPHRPRFMTPLYGVTFIGMPMLTGKTTLRTAFPDVAIDADDYYQAAPASLRDRMRSLKEASDWTALEREEVKLLLPFLTAVGPNEQRGDRPCLVLLHGVSKRHSWDMPAWARDPRRWWLHALTPEGEWRARLAERLRRTEPADRALVERLAHTNRRSHEQTISFNATHSSPLRVVGADELRTIITDTLALQDRARRTL